MSFWFWPLVFLVGGWWLAEFLGGQTVDLPAEQIAGMKTSADAHAVAILGMIAASAITIVTFVFSTLMVVLQLASSQLSPRILRKTIREGRAQMVMAILVGTFSYATRSLLLVYVDQDVATLWLLVLTAVALMFVSLLAFLYFVGFVADRVRAPAVIRAVATETDKWLKRTYAFQSPDVPPCGDANTEGLIRTEVRSRHTGYITGIEVRDVISWARKHDAFVEFQVGLGDDVTEDVVVGHVYCAEVPKRSARLAGDLQIAPERSIPGDPPWGFRLLVDIAIRALSPAVNDPTTAVQALDALEGLLSVLAQRSEQPGTFADEQGVVRLRMPVMSWRSYLVLSFQEIYQYGKASSQVTQRIAQALADLEEVVDTDDRRAALRELREHVVVVEPIIALEPPS